MLREEFLAPYQLSAQDLARRVRTSQSLIESILAERGEVTPDLALRLARLFGTTPEFWLNGQMAWNLYQAAHAPAAVEIATIQPLPQTTSADA